MKPPEVVFFAPGDPDEIYVFITAPAGTHINVTNQIAKTTEAKVRQILGPDNPDVESILTNVAINAGSNRLFDRSTQDRLVKITKFYFFKPFPSPKEPGR